MSKQKQTPPTRDPTDEVQETLRRIALGAGTDALALLGDELPDLEQLKQLDLRNVSSIKRGRGGMEIKFFDRLAALDQLDRRQARQTDPKAAAFYKALDRAAGAVKAAKENEHGK